MVTGPVPHAGTRIREEVIPKGMSVTKAAELMGVGRPALSNLLNGNAALSAEMATRLEKTFGRPLKELMGMQAQYEEGQAALKAGPEDAKLYVPPFLAIKANAINDWATHNIAARSRFAVFLRTLVHSTGRGLTRVNFPGNDDAESHGWDGYVEAGDGTPWVPAGYSGWEFGVDKNVKKKADGDFAARSALSAKARADTTFVFITPRSWPGKDAWVAAKNAEKLWKDVRAYDASDLEQWLEQSLPGQAWFANEKQIPARDVRSLDRCWSDWADVCKPALTGALFSSAIESARRTVLARLSKPSEAPIVIAADSAPEALAFLAQLLGEQGGNDLASFRDRVIVFDKPGVFPSLAAGTQTFIPVAHTREVERELAAHAADMHSFIVYPRNAAGIKPDITLEPVGYEVFNRALEAMGKSSGEVGRLARASGRSLTVLRRRLSSTPAMKTPEWAADTSAATSLMPFLFVGAWNSRNEFDKAALSLIADRSYEKLERTCHEFIGIDDAPMWSAGAFRGAVSKIDLMFATCRVITQSDLNRYFEVAAMVLGEDDPSLDLEEDKRWAASLYGKSREFSSTFREGISETLVLLAVHGGDLLNQRLGFNVEEQAVRLVQRLLPSPLSARTLKANDRDLRTYAEVAPDEFLKILERDLATESPAVFELLRPVDPNAFGSGPARSGLLWALEGLSWNRDTLPRAAHVLARLATVEINDNWTNKPINSLIGIFSASMPQTEANHDERLALLKALATKFPDVAWTLCVAQFGELQTIGHYSHKPRWRQDGAGFGEPITWEAADQFRRSMVEMALTWSAGYSLQMLCDLVERLGGVSDVYRKRIWGLIEQWAKRSSTSDNDKATMREKVRVSTLSRRVVRRRKADGEPQVAVAAKRIYAALEPDDPLSKHAWLFRSNWVEESADELEDIDKSDYRERELRIAKQRKLALQDIVQKKGLAGLLAISAVGEASWLMGPILVKDVLSDAQCEDLLRKATESIIAENEESRSYAQLFRSLLHSISPEEKRESILKCTMNGLAESQKARLLLLAPFERATWKLVDALGSSAQDGYWKEVVPGGRLDSDSEAIEAVQRLMSAKRPRAAFACIRNEPEKVDAQVLYRLLNNMARGEKDHPNEYLLDPYHVAKAFKAIDASSAYSREEKALLEFTYLDALSRPWDRNINYRIPNLEQHIEAHPGMFVQAMVWAYKRKGGGVDPDDIVPPADQASIRAEQGYKLLEALRRIPGHDEHGELQTEILERWVIAVREGGKRVGRLEVADNCIGKLLCHGPVGKDGVWPCEPIREVMERIQSDTLMNGAAVGTYNARGAQWRGEGGTQERTLAEKYKAWGRALQMSHPYVASRLLMRMVKGYEQDAAREDTESDVRRHLR